MTIKKSDSKKFFTKNAAKILTATMAAATVVAVLPADFTKADMPESDNVTDASYTDVTDEVYTVTPPVTEVPEIVVQSFVQALETVRSANSVESLQAALTAAELALNLTSYNTLDPKDRAAVAQALLNDTTPSKEDYADTAALQQALNKAVATQRDTAALRNAVAAVNSAGNAVQMKSALEAPYMGLVLMNYRKLSNDGKLEAAEAVLKAVPNGGFVSRAEIQNAFNVAVAPVFQTEAK